MNMKKIFAAMAATAVSASAFAAMTLTNANAAVSEIAYTQSEGSLSTDNDGKSMRRNIYNVWTTPQTTDIDGTTAAVENNITIDFTISGLNDGDAAKAWIAGSVAGAQVWTLEEAGDNAIDINGNGDYSVSWVLPADSANIDCLILQTDINCYNYGDFSGVAGSGVDIVVNSIKTGVEDPTEAPTEAPTTTAATTTAAGETTTTGATTTTKAGATTTKAANGGKTETSTNTGVAGVGVAASALALAGVAAFVARKKD
ncbi:MAG: NPXTG-anchored protein [Ruminococcus sp.]|nr:NPXTG-anchored protein [Ruminococcus sp.]